MAMAARVLGTTLESPVGPDHRPNLEANHQEIQEYLDQQGAYDLFDYLLKELLTKQPTDPLGHMLKCLETEHPIGPLKIIMHSAPNVGRTAHAKRLAQHWGLEYIGAGELLKENGVSTESIDFAEDDAVSRLVMERVQKAEDSMQGWVLDGFPRTRVQAYYLNERSAVPTHVLCLAASFDWIRQKNAEQGGEGAQTLEQKLSMYSCHGNALENYKDRTTVISAEQVPEAVWQEVERSVRRMPHSRCPLKPPARVLIFGPRGVGSREHASRLAARLGAVFVDFKEIPAHHSDAAGAMRDRLEELGVRLQQADCLAHGWVVCGAPVEPELVGILHSDPLLRPTRVAVLDASAETCVRRLHHLLLDGVTGKVWTSLPTNEKIRMRLTRKPEDLPDAVRAEHAAYCGRLPSLTEELSRGGAADSGRLEESSCQKIPADGPPLGVFNALVDFVERPLSLRPRQQ